jgi:uncharacterized protein Usg
MSKIPELSGRIVTKYLERYPEMPSLTLARLIHHSVDGHLIGDVEVIRSALRYYKGRSGKKNKVKLTNKKFLLEPEKDNPFSLPQESIYDYKPYFIPSELKRGLIIADIHIPYHDSKVITTILEYAKKYEPDFIILNEVLDFYQMSVFRKDPTKNQIKDELQAGRQFFGIMRVEFPDAHIVYHLGNHDDRFKYYLWGHPELYGIQELRLDNLLDLFNLGIDMVEDKRIIYIGKLVFVHGHEFGGGVSVPVNPARTLFLRSKTSAACAHYHQSSEHTESNIKGDMLTCWSIGCACQLHPEYRPINKWNNGFATVEKTPDGLFNFHNHRIFNGKIL